MPQCADNQPRGFLRRHPVEVDGEVEGGRVAYVAAPQMAGDGHHVAVRVLQPLRGLVLG